jgi:hypothetical protein
MPIKNIKQIMDDLKTEAQPSRNSLHFIGVGSGGCSVIKYFSRKLPNAKFTLINNKQPWWGIKERYTNITPHNFFINGEPVAAFSKEGNELVQPIEIINLLQPDEEYIFLLGLGGCFFVEYFLENVLPTFLNQQKKFTVIGTLPFSFEGKKRLQKSLNMYHKFKHLPNFKFFDLQLLKEKYGNKTLSEMYYQGNKEMYLLFMDAMFPTKT